MQSCCWRAGLNWKPDKSKTPLANEVTADGWRLCSAVQSASLATIAGALVKMKAPVLITAPDQFAAGMVELSETGPWQRVGAFCSTHR